MKKRPAIIYKNILLTHDGSALASKAVPHAISVAKQYGAKITLLRIVDDILFTVPNITPMGTTTFNTEVAENITGKEKHTAKAQLNRLKGTLLNEGISDVEVVVKDGVVAEEIIAFAKKQKFDLIVMSTHGASGIKRAILGSVADEVVRHAKTAVLLIRP